MIYLSFPRVAAARGIPILFLFFSISWRGRPCPWIETVNKRSPFSPREKVARCAPDEGHRNHGEYWWKYERPSPAARFAEEIERRPLPICDRGQAADAGEGRKSTVSIDWRSEGSPYLIVFFLGRCGRGGGRCRPAHRRDGTGCTPRLSVRALLRARRTDPPVQTSPQAR